MSLHKSFARFNKNDIDYVKTNMYIKILMDPETKMVLHVRKRKFEWMKQKSRMVTYLDQLTLRCHGFCELVEVAVDFGQILTIFIVTRGNFCNKIPLQKLKFP
jgi:hypothetical protein